MRYSAQTFAYLKRNFWLPILVMAVPSVAACFLLYPYSEVAFITLFDYDPFLSASKTFAILFGGSWHIVWKLFLVCGLQILAVSLLVSAVDRHFRTGKLSLDTPARLWNYSLFPVILSLLIVFAAAIAERFILLGLVMLVQVIFMSAHFGAVAALVVIAVIAVALFVFHVIITAPMLYWAPLMFVYGYRLRDAAASSFKILSGQKAGRGIVIPLCICAAIQVVTGFFNPYAAVTYAVNFILFLFTDTYVTVYVILSFYNICKLERRDVLPYENIPLPMPKKDKKSSKAANATSAERADKTGEDGDVG